MDIDEIVMKLIGPIQPIGCSKTDAERLENMKNLMELVNRLLFEIELTVPSADRSEASMRLIGTCATKFLNEVKESLQSNTNFN